MTIDEVITKAKQIDDPYLMTITVMVAEIIKLQTLVMQQDVRPQTLETRTPPIGER